ncbi:hypothetical protein ACM66B_002821 [Microbotryomycetes sp. NB124-2]
MAKVDEPRKKRLSCVIKAHPDSLIAPVRRESGLGLSNRRIKRLSPSATATSASASTASPGQDLATALTFFDIGNDDGRRKFMGASSQGALFGWLGQRWPGGPQALNPPQIAELPCEEVKVSPETVSQAALPPDDEMRIALDSYFNSFYRFFPIVDELSIRRLLESPTRGPLATAMLCVLCSLGISAQSQTLELDPDAEELLQTAWKSLPWLMGQPYRSSVQVMLLMAIAMRFKNRDGVCAMLTSLAVHIARTLGLHLQHANSLDSRIWYTAYCLEKIASIESGRPSSIQDSDCTVSLDAWQRDRTFKIGGDDLDLLGTLSRLCRQLSNVSAGLFSPEVMTLSAEETIARIGKADVALQRFADGTHAAFGLQNDILSQNEALPFVSPVFMLYHLALSTLHRLSLFDHAQLVEPHLFKARVQLYADRLRTSAAICVNSARATLSVLEQTRFMAPRLWTLHPNLSAALVLSIQMWQHPASWQSKADILILEHAVEFITDLFRACGYPEFWVNVFHRIFETMQARVEGRLDGKAAQVDGDEHAQTTPPTQTNAKAGSHDISVTAPSDPGQQLHGTVPHCPIEKPSQTRDLALQEVWPAPQQLPDGEDQGSDIELWRRMLQGLLGPGEPDAVNQFYPSLDDEFEPVTSLARLWGR